MSYYMKHLCEYDYRARHKVHNISLVVICWVKVCQGSRAHCVAFRTSQLILHTLVGVAERMLRYISRWGRLGIFLVANTFLFWKTKVSFVNNNFLFEEVSLSKKMYTLSLCDYGFWCKIGQPFRANG